jgi:hypothetical protein
MGESNTIEPEEAGGRAEPQVPIRGLRERLNVAGRSILTGPSGVDKLSDGFVRVERLRGGRTDQRHQPSYSQHKKYTQQLDGISILRWFLSLPAAARENTTICASRDNSFEVVQPRVLHYNDCGSPEAPDTGMVCCR